MKATFTYAIEGLVWSFKNHQNFQIHAGVSIFVLLLAWYLEVSRVETIILVFTVLLGFIVEMVNTSIEEITDLVTIKWAKQAKIAKDVAAGMMLLTAVAAGIIGSLIFIPYILQLL